MINLRQGQNPLLFLNCIIFIYCFSILGMYLTENNLHHLWSNTYLFLLIIVNSLIAIYLTIRQYHLIFIAYFCLFFLLGMLRIQLVFNLPDNNISHYDNQEITVIGKICQAPTIRQDDHGIYHLTYIVDTNYVEQQQKLLSSTGKIYLYQQSEQQPALGQINDTICATGKIFLIHNYHNPGLINRELMAREQHIYASLSIGKRNLKILTHDNSFSLTKSITEIQQQFITYLQNTISTNNASMLYAMIFGGYNNIDDNILKAYTITGIIHILSVSGSHISVLALFLLYLGKLFHLPRSLNFILLITVISLYTIFCGASIPVLRASIMGLLSITALFLGRLSTARHLLSIITLLFLLCDPLLLFNISFQLSFTSTAGLIYLLPLLRSLLNKLPSFIADNLALTLSAQIFTLPIISWYFNTFSLSSLIANFLIVPLLELLIIISLMAVIFSFNLTSISNILFLFADFVLSYCNQFILYLAKIPLANIYIATFNIFASLIYYLIISLSLNLKSRHYLYIKLLQYKFYFICLCIILCSLILFLFNQPKALQLHFIDVGQGDACLIITPQNHSVLIDTGGSLNSDYDIGTRVDIPYLHHYGITSIDYLILSHLDADHSGGAISILQKIPVKHLIISNEGLSNYAQALQLPLNNPILNNAIVAKENMSFSLDNVNFQFLQPDIKQLKSSNEASNVLKLTYHNFSALFTGDLPQTSEHKLIASHPHLQSTILKIAHHGSKTSSSEEFLHAVNPQLAIISVGKYNHFNHPSPEVLTRLQQLSINTLRTDEQGAIVISSDGYKFSIQTYLP